MLKMDHGLFGEKESEEEMTPGLVIRERRLKMTRASSCGSQRE